MQRGGKPAPEAAAEPDDEPRPALRLPADALVDRHRAIAVRLGGGPFVAGLLDRIVVEGRDLVLGHAIGRKPCRNMDVAEPLDVRENLVGTGAGDGAGGPEGVADEDDAGLLIAGVAVEVGRADLDVACYSKFAHDPLQPRQ